LSAPLTEPQRPPSPLTPPSPPTPSTRVVLAGMVGDSYGIDDGRTPIVLLHGQAFDRRSWRPVLDQLFRIQPDRRVVALDLPGYGESRAQLPHSNPHIIRALREAMDEIGFVAPVLVGHSSSGGMVCMYAAAHPTSGVVDVDAVPTDLQSLARTMQQLEPLISGARISEVWELMVEGFHLELLAPEVRNFILGNMNMQPDVLRSYWHEFIYGDPELIPDMLRGISAAIARAGVPVLLVAGAEPGPDLADLFGPALSQTTVEVWPNSGHFPHLAHAARFAERLAATCRWRSARRG